ncbi:translocation protein [Xylaria bambusicola]|uniref:translocation protein n=1 Tax=Xylaria bambusicola TaxID=326684 RepID=UPI0020076A0C|nr:translocation protein [Xylaria bambusicola]KAI0521349.1 translocation protein [Xylaria bambusicola]
MQAPNPGQGAPGGPGGPGGMPIGPNGMPMPTPQQIQAMQAQLAAEAQKHGMTVPQFVEHIKAQRMAQMQQMQQRQAAQGGAPGGPQPGQQGGPQGGPQGRPGPPPQGAQPGMPPPGQARPIRPGPPNPVAIALANFLRSQPLKPRTCIMNGDRKDMFRVKRALRALQSPAYAKARAKNPALPEIHDRASLENTFKLLPMSMLALRVTKVDPHEGHNHAPAKKAKRQKGLWTVRVEPQQEAGDDMYYVWLYEGSQIMRKVYAALALVVIFTLVLYPLWPLALRQGVYYLSWGFLGLLGLFFAMAIFRVILFCVTYFVVPPGLWLYPNLWEDVSFMDSFRPVWAWHETEKKKKKKTKKSAINAESAAHFAGSIGEAAPATASTTATETQIQTAPQQRTGYVAPQVEELGDDE